jgi:hypothetical protein
MKDRNRRERKVGPIAAVHIASVLDTPGAELVSFSLSGRKKTVPVAMLWELL